MNPVEDGGWLARCLRYGTLGQVGANSVEALDLLQRGQDMSLPGRRRHDATTRRTVTPGAGERGESVMAEQGHGTSGAQGPCWVICKDDASGGEWASLLTMRLSGWGKILPVFGSEDDALFFLRRWDSVSRVSLEALQTARAQLASALLGALSDVDRVVFDPLPEPDLRDTIRLTSLCRGVFVDLVLGRGKAWSARDDHGGSRSLRRGAVRP